MNLDIIGSVDMKTKTYSKVIDARTQMFHHYGESIAISKYIIRNIIGKNQLEYIRVRITNYPKEPKEFIAEISFKHFLENCWDTTNMFKGKNRADAQLATPLRFWDKIIIKSKDNKNAIYYRI